MSKHYRKTTTDELALILDEEKVTPWNGIERIRAALKNANCPNLEVRFSSLFTLVFPRPTYQVDIDETPVETAKTRVKTTKTPVEKPVKTPDLILQALRQKPTMTLAQVAEQLNKSLSAVERASAKLVKDGKLQHVRPQKGGRWQVID
jgi:ATP-dependent DNA helicase RecG